MESQTPPGSKPPVPPPQAPKKEEPTAWISPRLREKLMEAESYEPKKSSPVPAIVFTVLVIAAAVGGFVVVRSNMAKHNAEMLAKARAAAADSAAAAAAAARADSIRLAAAADSAAMAASTGKGAKPGAKPASSSGAKPAGGTASASTPSTGTKPAAGAGATKPAAGAGATAAAAAKPASTGPFGIDVGSFLFEERANSEQARLASATGLTGRVITKTSGGESSYHAVLGSFGTRAAAQKQAEDLVSKGLVNEIHIVALNP